MIVRTLAAAFGAGLVVVAGSSVIGTVVVPRAFESRLTTVANWMIDRLFWGVERWIRDAQRRDEVLAFRAALLLLAQLGVWLVTSLLGFAFLLLPFTNGGLGYTISEAASAMTTIGFAVPQNPAEKAIVVMAAFASLGTLALQIGYLPALYGAYNRRETSVSLLTARAGVPTWGPELLARTHFGLGTGDSSMGTLPDLYADWERWAADVTESHRTYLPLVYFRSHRTSTSWVTALLGVLDSAALYLALCPSAAPTIPARLCLRSGFLCFTRIAQALGVRLPDEADPSSGTTLTYEEFVEGVARLRTVDFPIEREPEEAWPDFLGWRVNYERAAYAVAWAVSAPPALWSGPRRIPAPPVPPVRPPDHQSSAQRPTGHTTPDPEARSGSDEPARHDANSPRAVHIVTLTRDNRRRWPTGPRSWGDSFQLGAQGLGDQKAAQEGRTVAGLHQAIDQRTVDENAFRRTMERAGKATAGGTGAVGQGVVALVNRALRGLGLG